MRRVAIKTVYLGWLFHGSQVQPGVPTVEGEILRALRRTGFAEGRDGCGFRAAGRTDRGVSALGNVFSFIVRGDADLFSLANALNAEMRGVFVRGVAGVGEGFDPRRASERWYRYFFPIHPRVAEGFDFSAVEKAARLFVGRHDFSCFSKGDERNPVREVFSVDTGRLCFDGGDVGMESFPRTFLVVDIRGESFLWQMVRRITGALVMVGRGDLDIGDIEALLQRPSRSSQRALPPPVPPEGLVLMDVKYGRRDRGADEVEFLDCDVRISQKKAWGLWVEGSFRFIPLMVVLAPIFSGDFSPPPW